MSLLYKSNLSFVANMSQYSYFNNLLSANDLTKDEYDAINKAFYLVEPYLPTTINEPEARLNEIFQEFYQYRDILAAFHRYDFLNFQIVSVFLPFTPTTNISWRGILNTTWSTLTSSSEIGLAPKHLSNMKTRGFLTPETAFAFADALEEIMQENSHSPSTPVSPTWLVTTPLQLLYNSSTNPPLTPEQCEKLGVHVLFFVKMYKLGLFLTPLDSEEKLPSYDFFIENIDSIKLLSHAFFQMTKLNIFTRSRWQYILEQVTTLSMEKIDTLISQMESTSFIRAEMKKEGTGSEIIALMPPPFPKTSCIM